MQELFKTIRTSSSTHTWSKGVALNRDNRVHEKLWSDDEIILSIIVKNKPINPTVSLWPNEEDWNCDCHSNTDPCEHVIASVIAVKQAQENGKKLPQLKETIGEINYHFSQKDGFLYFERKVLLSGRSELLSVSLTALSSGRIKGPKLAPDKIDINADYILDGNRSGGKLSQQILHKLITVLGPCTRVFLDNKPIACSADATGYIACIKDENAGVRLYSKKDPNISAVFRNGVALCSQKITPLYHISLPPEDLKMLAAGQFFGPKELNKLVSETIPKLKKQMKVEISGSNLPKSTNALPRIVWESQKHENTLELVPIIVYGRPIKAKVIDNELVPLGSDVPCRQMEKELRLKEEFARANQGSSVDHKLEFFGAGGVKAVQNLQQKKAELTGTGWEAFIEYPELQVSIDPIEDDLDFDAQFSSKNANGKVTADPYRVMEAWENSQSLVPLMEGGWAPLPKNWLSKHGAQLRDLLQVKKENGAIPHALAPSLCQFYDDLEQEVPKLLHDWHKIANQFNSIPKSKLCTPLHATLRPYQKYGIDWLSFLKSLKLGALLADDMGLGKTLQAIAVMTERTLIVAPTSVLQNWQNEINKFRPNLSSFIYHGPDRMLDTKKDIMITSYSILRLDLEKIREIAFSTVVIDEAQYIKNPKSLASQAIFKIDAGFKVALSGTPIENKLEDLWSIFHFINPGLLGNLAQFQKNYIQPILAGGDTAHEQLQKKTKPFVLRRLKSEVATDLPQRTNMTLHCDLSSEEQDIYNSIKLACQKEVMEKLAGAGKVIQALEVLLRLRQAACHRALLPNQKHITNSSKLSLLIDSLEKVCSNGHKALVFSQWTSFLDLMEPELNSGNFNYLRIDGSSKNRQDIVQRFQTDAKINILILSLKSAGVGLNLTAADHVFITDPWWNPAVEEQAADRAHRIGQDKPVFVTKLVSRNTVEEKILELQEAKRNLAGAIVGKKSSAQSLSKEDLLNLLA